jgi:hypothetical protein
MIEERVQVSQLEVLPMLIVPNIYKRYSKKSATFHPQPSMINSILIPAITMGTFIATTRV